MPEPLFSVIIPTFARPERLRDCLSALARLDAGGDFEVVVVDDGSPDPIDHIVAEFASTIPVRLVTQTRRGPGAARNAGAAVARGRYLAFTDDDCRPAPGWLAALASESNRDAAQLLGGRVENALGNNLFSEASERITQFVYEFNRSGGANEPFFTTNNLSLPADLFRSVGGFTKLIPSATAEDKEFCDRWRARGLPLVHVPHAVVFHAHVLTFRGFLRQHYNYGRGILAFRLLRQHRGASGVIPEQMTFYLKLLASPLRHPVTTSRWRLFGLLLLSQMAVAAGALAQALYWRQLKQMRATAQAAKA